LFFTCELKTIKSEVVVQCSAYFSSYTTLTFVVVDSPIFSGSSEDLQMGTISLRPIKKTSVHSGSLKSTRSVEGTAGKRRTRTTSATYTSAGDGLVVRSGTRTIYTAGRPPWYDSLGQLKEPFVIGMPLIACVYC